MLISVRKKLHSIVVELPMLKDNLRRIGGVETLLYFLSGRRTISSVYLNNIYKLRTVFHAIHSFNEY